MTNPPVQNHPDNQWPMTDDELINSMASNLEKVLNASLDGNGLHAVQNQAIKDKFYRLISLARIGAAVKAKEPTAFDTLPDDYEVN